MAQQPPPPPQPGPQPGGPGASGWDAAGGWTPPKPAGPAPGVLYASNGARLGAFIVDALIMGVVVGLMYAILFGLLFGAIGDGFGTRSAGPFIVMFGLFPLLIVGQYVILGAYLAVSWYRGGATVGMRLARIRVVRSADGGPLTKQQAVLRAIGYWVSSMVMWLGFAWILIDDRRQGWHDKMADTLVIQAD